MPIGLQTTTLSLMPSLSRLPRKKELVLFLVFVLSGSMWFYLHYIGPREKERYADPDAVKDTHGDLFSPWYGSRELLVNHRDPYSVEVTREIQNGYYGKTLTGAPHEPRDQQRFAYPVYVVFLFSPFVHLPFNTVRVIFWWMLPAITLTTIPAWLRLVGIRASVFLIAVLAAMTITAVPVFRGLNCFAGLGFLTRSSTRSEIMA